MLWGSGLLVVDVGSGVRKISARLYNVAYSMQSLNRERGEKRKMQGDESLIDL